jgi:hypothetical protein
MEIITWIASRASYERLECLLERHLDLLGDGLSGEVIGIDIVGPQFIADAQLIQQSHGVGLRSRREQPLSLDAAIYS